jgi:hypothetical protein
MVKRVYGHLGTVRHRAKVVEYRVEQHAKNWAIVSPSSVRTPHLLPLL